MFILMIIQIIKTGQKFVNINLCFLYYIFWWKSLDFSFFVHIFYLVNNLFISLYVIIMLNAINKRKNNI